MNFFKIIFFIAAFYTPAVLSLYNDSSFIEKPEENKTFATTEKPVEKKSDLNISQSSVNFKRSINYGYNPYDPQYRYNSYIPKQRNRKGKSRSRKSRQKNKKGKGKKNIDVENKTRNVNIKNNKPIINMNFDSLYKNSKNGNPKINLERKNGEPKYPDSKKLWSQQENRKSRSESKKSEPEQAKSETQNQKSSNNNSSIPDQQTHKSDSKKSEIVIKSSLSEDNKPEHVIIKPEAIEQTTSEMPHQKSSNNNSSTPDQQTHKSDSEKFKIVIKSSLSEDNKPEHVTIKPEAIEQTKSEMPNQKFSNSSSTPDQQTHKSDSEKSEIVIKASLSEDNNLEHITVKPEAIDKDYKASNQDTSIPPDKFKLPSNISAISFRKSEIFDNANYNPEDGIKLSENKKPKVSNKKLEPESQPNPALHLHRLKIEKKEIEHEIKKFVSTTDPVPNTKPKYKNETNSTKILPLNIKNEFKLKEVVVPESKITEFDLKLIKSESVKTEIKEKHFLSDKNNKSTTEIKESQFIPVKAQSEKENKSESKNKLTMTDKQIESEAKKSLDLKKTESENKQLESNEKSKPKYENFKTKDEHKQIDLKSTNSETESKKLENKNNEAEFTNSDLEALFSDLGIKIPEPQINHGLETNPKPGVTELVQTDHKNYTLDPKKQHNKPSALEPNVSKQNNFKNKETRSTQIKLELNHSEPTIVKHVSSKESKFEKSKSTSSILQGEQNKSQRNHHKVVLEQIPGPELTVLKTGYDKNILESKSQSNYQKRIPEFTVRNNNTPKPKHIKSDPRHQIIDVRSSKYQPANGKTTIDYENLKPEEKHFKSTSPILQSEKNKSKRDHHKAVLEQKITEINLANSASALKKSIPHHDRVVLAFGNSKSHNKKTESRGEQRQPRPNYKGSKPEIVISTNLDKLKPRTELKPRTNVNKLESRTDTDDLKNKKTEPNNHEIVFEFGTPEPKINKSQPAYINRKPKHRIAEPKIRTSESRYKKPRLESVLDHRKNGSYDKVVNKFDKVHKDKPHKPKTKYVNERNEPKEFKIEYQNTTKIAYEDRVAKKTRFVTELKKFDRNYRTPEQESKLYEPTYKKIRPRQLKVVDKYGNPKPDYKESESRYNKHKPGQEILGSDYRNLKPKYEKFRPYGIIETESDKAYPQYRFKNKKVREKGFISIDKEEKEGVSPKYKGAKINDELEYIESKIKYKFSETKNRSSAIDLKLSDLKSLDSKRKKSESTTEKIELEIETIEPGLKILEPKNQEGNTTTNKSFFYKVINKWW